MNTYKSGNFANLRYEAENTLRDHLVALTTVTSTRETSRWKEPQPDYHLEKQYDKLLVNEMKTNTQNQILQNRLEGIAIENRKDTTREYAPGWRVGEGGVFIDCYTLDRYESVKLSMDKSHVKTRVNQHEKRIKENQEIAHYLSQAKSEYERTALEQKYRERKKSYDTMRQKTASPTSLHLGLISAAKKVPPHTTHTLPGPYYYATKEMSQSPSPMNEGVDLANSFFDDHKKDSTTKARPTTAPNKRTSSSPYLTNTPSSSSKKVNAEVNAKIKAHYRKAKAAVGVKPVQNELVALEDYLFYRNSKSPSWNSHTCHTGTIGDGDLPKPKGVPMGATQESDFVRAQKQDAIVEHEHYLSDRCTSILQLQAEWNSEKSSLSAFPSSSSSAAKHSNRPKSSVPSSSNAQPPQAWRRMNSFKNSPGGMSSKKENGGDLHQAGVTAEAKSSAHTRPQSAPATHKPHHQAQPLSTAMHASELANTIEITSTAPTSRDREPLEAPPPLLSQHSHSMRKLSSLRKNVSFSHDHPIAEEQLPSSPLRQHELHAEHAHGRASPSSLHPSPHTPHNRRDHPHLPQRQDSNLGSELPSCKAPLRTTSHKRLLGDTTTSVCTTASTAVPDGVGGLDHPKVELEVFYPQHHNHIHHVPFMQDVPQEIRSSERQLLVLDQQHHQNQHHHLSHHHHHHNNHRHDRTTSSTILHQVEDFVHAQILSNTFVAHSRQSMVPSYPSRPLTASALGTPLRHDSTDSSGTCLPHEDDTHCTHYHHSFHLADHRIPSHLRKHTYSFQDHVFSEESLLLVYFHFMSRFQLSIRCDRLIRQAHRQMITVVPSEVNWSPSISQQAADTPTTQTVEEAAVVEGSEDRTTIASDENEREQVSPEPSVPPSPGFVMKAEEEFHIILYDIGYYLPSTANHHHHADNSGRHNSNGQNRRRSSKQHEDAYLSTTCGILVVYYVVPVSPSARRGSMKSSKSPGSPQRTNFTEQEACWKYFTIKELFALYHSSEARTSSLDESSMKYPTCPVDFGVSDKYEQYARKKKDAKSVKKVVVDYSEVGKLFYEIKSFAYPYGHTAVDLSEADNMGSSSSKRLTESSSPSKGKELPPKSSAARNEGNNDSSHATTSSVNADSSLTPPSINHPASSSIVDGDTSSPERDSTTSPTSEKQTPQIQWVIVDEDETHPVISPCILDMSDNEALHTLQEWLLQHLQVVRDVQGSHKLHLELKQKM